MTNEKAIRVLEHIEYYLKTHTNESCEEEHTAIAIAIKALEARPKGEWINREAVSNTIFPFWERYECNQCHKFNGYSNFCPNCGADMRGGAE